MGAAIAVRDPKHTSCNTSTEGLALFNLIRKIFGCSVIESNASWTGCANKCGSIGRKLRIKNLIYLEWIRYIKMSCKSTWTLRFSKCLHNNLAMQSVTLLIYERKAAEETFI